MREVVNIVFGALFTIVVAWAAGSLLLERLRLTFFRLEGTLFAFIAGAGCLSLFTTLLCFIHQARRGIFLWTGLAVIGVAAWRALRRPRQRSLPAVPLNWLVPFYVL